MWMKIDADTGAIIERNLVNAPEVEDGEEVVRETSSPSAVWTPSIKAWRFDPWLAAIQHVEDDLDALKTLRWEFVKQRREAAKDGGCETPLGRVDTDVASRGNISGAANGAVIATMAGQPFSIDWTMADNTTISHDGPAMTAMGMTVLQHISACHAVANAKRDAIMAATIRAEIEAVSIDMGWPS